jgi:hypothetical protein
MLPLVQVSDRRIPSGPYEIPERIGALIDGLAAYGTLAPVSSTGTTEGSGSAKAVSLVGDEVFDTTLLVWIGTVLLAGRPHEPVISSAVLIVTSTVIVLLGPIAGVFGDRWDKRRTMMRADGTRAVLIGLLVVVAALGSRLPLPATTTAIAVVVLLATAAARLFKSARMVIVADVVPGSLGRAGQQLQPDDGCGGRHHRAAAGRCAAGRNRCAVGDRGRLAELCRVLDRGAGGPRRAVPARPAAQARSSFHA